MEIWRFATKINGANKSKYRIVAEILDDRIKLRIKAAAVDGKANEAIIKVLSKEFRTPKSHIRILSGHTSKKKTVKIHKPGHLPDLPGLGQTTPPVTDLH